MLQLIKAPSILGLRPSGVECLADALLDYGLDVYVTPSAPLLEVNDLNHLYSSARDTTGMINAEALRGFSLRLKKTVADVVSRGNFPVVLGGDCSILLGILPALKTLATYGLVTLDAHADFYLSSQSITGEAADMDIALVTGRGPELLTDIDGLGPYVQDAHVIHIGQRDEEETQQYGSTQISETAISRYGLDSIRERGIDASTHLILGDMAKMDIAGFWLHLDTDVIHDEENPAVDYRLPDGLRLAECERLMSTLAQSGHIKGLSISIYNPNLDPNGRVGKSLAHMIGHVLDGVPIESDSGRIHS